MNKADEAVKRSDLVGSLAKGLDVIEILAANPDGLTLTEAADEAGLTRAGSRRLLLTLLQRGWAAQDGRRFRLSPRVLSLTRSWLDGQSLWNYALGPMRDLATRLNESCSAAVLADEDIVYVARVPGERIVSVDLHVGTHLPAFCTSMGRVLLSDLPPEKLDKLLARIVMRARTPRTVTRPDALRRILDQIAADGYALVDEELEIGLRSIAVPVRSRSGRFIAALNVSTQSARHTPDAMIEHILPALRTAARSIEDYSRVQ